MYLVRLAELLDCHHLQACLLLSICSMHSRCLQQMML